MNDDETESYTIYVDMIVAIMRIIDMGPGAELSGSTSPHKYVWNVHSNDLHNVIMGIHNEQRIGENS
jgi:hypothetical protein